MAGIWPSPGESTSEYLWRLEQIDRSRMRTQDIRILEANIKAAKEKLQAKGVDLPLSHPFVEDIADGKLRPHDADDDASS